MKRVCIIIVDNDLNILEIYDYKPNHFKNIDELFDFIKERQLKIITTVFGNTYFVKE